MRKVYNFAPGPALLPEEVLLQAQQELLNWHNTGMSVMEISHRGKEFAEVVAQTEADVRELLNLPKNYQVLFTTGGATAQFAMVPMNFIGKKKTADYVNTGIWSEKAIEEAKTFGEINIVANTQKNPRIFIPSQESWKLNPNAAYLHYTPNETINGIEFHWTPDSGDVPLIADMSSNIFSRSIDVSKFGLIYAGAQKNMGQAGITLVIIRDDLLENAEYALNTPSLYRYKTYAENQSLQNTPPTFSWYLAGLVLTWIKKQGGLTAMAAHNQRKAEKLYQAIDQSTLYFNEVDPSCRSWMNVPFSLRNPELNQTFLEEAKQAGLVNLAGHRLVGGMRASIYNAMPEEGVDALIDFMQVFAARHYNLINARSG